MVSVMAPTSQRVEFDLERQSVRELNQFLHGDLSGVREVLVKNPDGAHSIAVGMNAAVRVDIDLAFANRDAVAHGAALERRGRDLLLREIEVARRAGQAAHRDRALASPERPGHRARELRQWRTRTRRTMAVARWIAA